MTQRKKQSMKYATRKRTPRGETGSRRPARHARRGNAMILVTGVLVLLVIIATAYVTRTGTGRVTSVAAQRLTERQPIGDRIGGDIADLIKNHLFVRLVDGGVFPPGSIANSNTPRLPLRFDARRYGRDEQPGVGGLAYPYNFAPFSVRPWTNLPDTLLTIDVPDEPGFPGYGDHRWLASSEPALIDLGAIPGNHGYYDTFAYWRHMSYLGTANNSFRLVADLSDVENSLVTNLNLPVESFGILDWAAANFDGEYRLPAGGSDLYGANGFFNGAGGLNFDQFNLYWNQWFSSFNYWELAATAQAPMPPNYFYLPDLDLDYVVLEDQERPEDTFRRGSARWHVERRLADADGDGATDSFWWSVPFSASPGVRHVVAVRIVDNAGMVNVNTSSRFVRRDPFPDDFESALDPSIDGSLTYRTTGATPMDMALIGRTDDLAASNSIFGFTDCEVGIFDNEDHHGLAADPGSWNNSGGFIVNVFDSWLNALTNPDHPPVFGAAGQTNAVRWHQPVAGFIPMWNSYIDSFGRSNNLMTALGIYGLDPNPPADGTFLTRWNDRFEQDPFVRDAGFGADDPRDFLAFGENRRQYWLNFARYFDGETTPGFDLRPFDVADELELRMFAGNNYPFVLSRFERAMAPNPYYFISNAQTDALNGGGNLLRTATEREESNPFLDQLTPREMVFDLRHRLTFVNNTRNETMPPWLWQEGNDTDYEDSLRIDLQAEVPTGAAEFADFRAGVFARLYRALLTEDGEGYFADNGGTTDPILAQRTANMAAAMTENLIDYLDVDSSPSFNPAPVITPPGFTPGPTRTYAGLEMQPFFTEAYIAHVYEPIALPINFIDPTNTTNYIAEMGPLGDTGSSSTIAVVQLANPFPRSRADTAGISLQDYAIKVFGRAWRLPNVILPYAEYGYDPITGQERTPPTVTCVLIDGDELDQADWLRILALENPPAGSIIVPVPISTAPDEDGWSVDPNDYWDTTNLPTPDPADDGSTLNARSEAAVELVRFLDSGEAVLVDRLRGYDDFTDEYASAELLRTARSDMLGPSGTTADETVPNMAPIDTLDPAYDEGLDIGENDALVSEILIRRPWAADFDPDELFNPSVNGPLDANNQYDPWEIAPRYIFAVQEITEPREWEYTMGATPPDGAAETTFHVWAGDFDVLKKSFDFSGTDVIRMFFPYQMLHRDGPAVQAGEIYNVHTWSHEFESPPVGSADVALGTVFRPVRTFSEFMANGKYSGFDSPTGNGGGAGDFDVKSYHTRINRLMAEPTPIAGLRFNAVVGADDPMVPDIPAASRIIDTVVCDTEAGLAFEQSIPEKTANPLNPNSVRGTPGLLNVNTASIEAMRALPFMARLPRETIVDDIGTLPFTRSRVPEGVYMYRELDGSNPSNPDPDYRPDWRERDSFGYGLRETRGLESIGELLLLRRDGVSGDPLADTAELTFNESFTMDFAAERPYRDNNVPDENWRIIDAQLSTDVMRPLKQNSSGDLRRVADGVAGDFEEEQMLFSGLSNMVTTRSDTFTVYFRVRTFRQNPETGVWDATDREQIVDDTRYVMLVDRSQVDSPNDEPRILYLEEIPD